MSMVRLRWPCAVLALACTSAIHAAPIPFKRESDVGAANIGGGALGVLLVSLVAIGAVLYLRKRLRIQVGAGAMPRLMTVLETQRLGPKVLLSVVEFDGKRYLIAQGEHGVNCLAQSPMADQVAPGAPA